MTFFGWITVIMWAILTIGTARGNAPSAAFLSLFMLVGTLVWGTGSL